jgi:PAS domain S-box-containing protein
VIAAREPQRQELESGLILKSLIHSFPIAILSLDRAGELNVWNQAATDITGWTIDELKNRPSQFLSLDSYEKFSKLHEAVLQGETFHNIEMPFQKKDGSIIKVNLNLSPLIDSNLNIVGTTALFHKDLADSIIGSSSQSSADEYSTLTKLEYLKMVYHELRVPLVSLLGWIQLIRLTKIDDRETIYQLETIERTAQMVAHLIEDLLDITSMEEGRFGHHARLIDFITVIKTAINMVSPLIDSREIRFKVVFEPGACLILGDPIRLQQVVWNLFSNAIKFTPKGGSITARVEKSNSDVKLIVTDTGEGISSERLPKIFERYRQSDWNNLARHKGLGLGLAIAKHIVTLHHGTIEASSDGDGLGSTFTVKLPLAKSTKQ